MGCRCEELALCEADKEILIEAKSIVKEMYPESAEIAVQLGKMTIHSQQAYETDNIGEICTAIEELDDDLDPAIEDWLTQIDKTLEALEEIEIVYREEDRLFHESAGEQDE